MTNVNPETLYRTTPARTGKMMVIMLGICIVGGVIFFSMWDYWISEPAPVVAMMAGSSDHAAPAAQTGQTITQDLSFIDHLISGLWHLIRCLVSLTIIQPLT